MVSPSLKEGQATALGAEILGSGDSPAEFAVADSRPTPRGFPLSLRLWRNAALYVLANGLQRGATVAIMPLLLARLSLGEYGRYGLVLSIYALLPSFLCLGLYGAIARFYFDSKDPAGRRRITGTLLLSHASSTFVIAALLDLLLGAFVPSINSLQFHPDLRLAIWASAAVALFEGVMAFWRSAERPLRVGIAQLTSFACTIGAIAFFLFYKNMGLSGVLWGLVLGQGAVSLVVFGAALAETGVAWQPRVLRDAFAYSLPLLPHLTVGWTLRASDRWILEHFRGAEQLGTYFFSYQVCSLISLIMFSSNDAIVPRFLAAYRDDGPEGARRFHARIFTIYCWAAVALACAVILGSPLAAPLLSRGKIAQTPILTAMLAAAMVASAVYVPFANALFALKATARLTLVTVSCGLLDICLNLILVPHFGGRGSAFSMLASYVVLLLLVSRLAHRRLGLDRHLGTLASAGLVLLLMGFLVAR